MGAAARASTVSILLLATAGISIAQSLGDYLQLLERYRTSSSYAIEQLATWPLEMLQERARQCLPRTASRSGDVSRCSTRQRVTAVMLHTDAAGILIDRDPARADEQTDIAEGLASTITDPPEFALRWYEIVAMMNMSRTRAQVALDLANRAVRQHSREASAYALRGAVVEVNVLINYPDLRGQMMSGEPLPRVERELIPAIRDYERALELNPLLATTRLRLGWVRVLSQETGAGRRDLIRARSDARDDETKYLAEMFLGTAYERERQPAEAVAAYQRARAIGPSYQTGCIALSHAESARGNGARAAALAAECLQLATVEDPWWAYRLGGYDLDRLAWLRAEARKR